MNKRLAGGRYDRNGFSTLDLGFPGVKSFLMIVAIDQGYSDDKRCRYMLTAR
jgi:hypothetical protein